MNTDRILVVAVYSHPEYLPPTLNAIELLSKQFEHIYVVHRNISGFDWQYPINVTLLSSGSVISVREAESKKVGGKVADFLRFTLLLLKTLKKHKSRSILLYDYIPILAYKLIYFILPKPDLLWYHNHDVAEKKVLNRISISYWAWKSEKWIFSKLNIFSLPAMERKQYFPMKSLKGDFFFIPNYPSRQVYERIANLNEKPTTTLRIIFQGSIGPKHGLEEIISILNESINNKKLTMVLKGFVNDVYKNELLQLAKKNNVENNLLFLPPTGYDEVLENLQSCHIGIGIHAKADIMNTTLGTASNKIYEYAACGIPVLLLDNLHFRKILGDREWAFFTDLSKSSLIKCLVEIDNNYSVLSKSAKSDFYRDLYFEKYFNPLVSIL